MSQHVTISREEAADRLAIRNLSWPTHTAPAAVIRRARWLSLPQIPVVYMNAKDSKPSRELPSREALAPVFADLNKYDATTHFVG